MPWSATPVVAAALLALAPAPPRAEPQGIAAEWCTHDPKLTRGVSVAEPRIFVGELLERMGAQAGVALATGERDGSGDAQVCAYFDDARLCDILDGLWSLLSYQGGVYTWHREGRPGAYTYRLERPQGARNLAARLEALSQTMFEEDVRTLLHAAGALPSERRRIVEAAARLRGDADPSAACPVLPRTWAGLQAIKENLTPEQLTTVLRGRSPASSIRVPVSELGPKGRELVKLEYDGQVDSVGSRPRREPEWLSFERQRTGNEAPWLCLYIDGMCGYGYAGGEPTTRTLSKRIVGMWQLPGDRKASPGDARPVERPTTVAGSAGGADLPGWTGALARRVHEIYCGSGQAVLARVPSAASEPGSPYGGTVGAYRSRLDVGRHLTSKWRGDILLLDYPFWFYDEPEVGTWHAVKLLRDSAAGNEGYLTVADLAAVARTFTAERLRELTWRLPALGIAAELRDVLVAACPSRLTASQLLSDQGRPLSPELLSAVRAHAILGNALNWGPARALRIVEKKVGAEQPAGRRGREMTIGFVSDKGEFVPVMGLMQVAPAP